MTTDLAHESELEFELGGPAYRLMQRIGLIQGAGLSLGRRAIGFLLITWVPLLLFSLIEGRALGPTPKESFLLDFATYARFFLAVPLIFMAEVVAGPRLRAAGLHFVQGNFVRPKIFPPSRRPLSEPRGDVKRSCRNWSCSASPCWAPGISPSKP